MSSALVLESKALYSKHRTLISFLYCQATENPIGCDDLIRRLIVVMFLSQIRGFPVDTPRCIPNQRQSKAVFVFMLVH